jgi:hypothetical protein
LVFSLGARLHFGKTRKSFGFITDIRRASYFEAHCSVTSFGESELYVQIVYSQFGYRSEISYDDLR